MFYDQSISVLYLDVDVSNIRVQFTDYLCCIFVIFGLIGNAFGLSIFSSSHRTRRISTVYVYLATSSSIINIFCVIRYALILHSRSQEILRHLAGNVWLACKMYELSFSFRVMSSWITLCWMFERLTCVSRRLRAIFHRWNASSFKFLLPILLLILILIAVIGPPLVMYQPQRSLLVRNELKNVSVNPMHGYCGLNSDASNKSKKYFNEIHFGLNHYTIRCLFSELIPAGGIIFFNVCILYHLCRTSYHFDRRNSERKIEERKRTTTWMNVVLICHSSLFFLSLLSHIIGHLMSVEAHETWWVLLAVLANCSLNFYLYCLSGQAFRKQVIHFIQQITTQNLDKFRRRKDQWQRRHSNIKPTDRLTVYQRKTEQKSLHANSSSHSDEEDSPL